MTLWVKVCVMISSYAITYLKLYMLHKIKPKEKQTRHNLSKNCFNRYKSIAP